MTRPALAAASRSVHALTARAERLVRGALIALVRAYRLLLSPTLGSSCRFAPTCSAYALQALERHGAGRGSTLTLARLARCHPWCDGGIDEVPETAARRTPSSPRLFSRLLSPSSQKNLHE